MDDGALMQLVVRRDAAAFGVLVRRHLRNATALAFAQLVDQDDAEDVVQEAFVVVWQRAARFDVARPFAPWLYAIVRNLARRRRERAARRSRLLRLFTGARETPSPERAVEAADLARRVQDAMGELPEMQCHCFTLYAVQHVPVREIAAMYDVAESTVRQHVFRAKHALREKLGSELLPDEGEAYG